MENLHKQSLNRTVQHRTLIFLQLYILYVQGIQPYKNIQPPDFNFVEILNNNNVSTPFIIKALPYIAGIAATIALFTFVYCYCCREERNPEGYGPIKGKDDSNENLVKGSIIGAVIGNAAGA